VLELSEVSREFIILPERVTVICIMVSEAVQ